MEPQLKTNKWQIITKFAIVYALIVIGFGLILYIFNLTMKAGLVNTVVNLVALFGSIYFGILAHRNQNLNGYINYGQSLGIGFLISLVAGIIVAVYQLVFSTYIAPEMAQNMLNEAKRQMIESNASEEDIQMTVDLMKKLSDPKWILLGGIGGTAFLGLIAALVISAFTKKEDPDGAYNNL
jgi:hypothetical protein